MESIGTGTPAEQKNFWALDNFRPESLVGKAVAIGLGITGAYYLLPVINSIIWNVISISIGLGIIGAALAVIVDGRIPRLLNYLFKASIRGTVGFFIAINPIAIMKSYYEDVLIQIKKFSEAIGKLRGAIDKTNDAIERYKSEMTAADNYVRGAIKNGNQGDPTVRTQAGISKRRSDTIDQVTKMRDKMVILLQLLERFYNKSIAYRDDLKDQIDFEASRRETLQIASGAFQNARRILAGDTIGADMYDQALTIANDQAAAMLGEMKQFVFESQDIMKTFEMKQDADVEAVLARLDAAEKLGNDSLLLTYQKGDAQQLPALAVSGGSPVRVPVARSIDQFLNN